MIIKAYCCPKCGAYSGDCFKVKEVEQPKFPLSTLPRETIECMKCGWKGSWGTTKHVREEN